MKCIICGKEIEDEKEEIVLPCSQSNGSSDYVSAHKDCCLNGLWYNPDTETLFKNIGE